MNPVNSVILEGCVANLSRDPDNSFNFSITSGRCAKTEEGAWETFYTHVFAKAKGKLGTG
jgi:hypothetical protein